MNKKGETKTKRLTAVLLTLLMMAASMTSLPLIATAETSGIYTYTVSESEATITDCDSSASGESIIPSTLGGYPVTAIGDYAFYGCERLTTVTIPDSVTTIGNEAFSYCYGLTAVKIGNNVKTIGVRAFAGCGGLITITIPVSVERISEGAFAFCYRLTTVYYEGGRERFESIVAENNNDILFSATLRPKAKYIEYQTGGGFIIHSDVALSGAKVIFVAYKGKEIINMRVLTIDIPKNNLLMGNQIDFSKADTAKVMIWSGTGVTPLMDMLEIILK